MTVAGMRKKITEIERRRAILTKRNPLFAEEISLEGAYSREIASLMEQIYQAEREAEEREEEQ